MPQIFEELLEKLQKTISYGWGEVKTAILNLNPIPEPLRPILSSRYFWFIVWIAAFSSLGRSLLGGRIGNWIGLSVGGWLWYLIMPQAGPELPVLILAIISLPILSKWVSEQKWGRLIRGVKICPDCAEEVKVKAKVCKHCSYRFYSPL
jgi:hypothetical protein